MCTQNVFWSKILNNLLQNYSKVTEIAITACKLSKIFRESMPPNPPIAFLVSSLASNYFCRKNTLEKNVVIMPPRLKFLATPLPALVVGEKNLAIAFGPSLPL